MRGFVDLLLLFTDNNAALGSFVSSKASLAGVEKVLQLVYNIEVAIGSRFGLRELVLSQIQQMPRLGGRCRNK